MKLHAVVLAGSLLANVVLFSVFAFRPALAPPAVRDLIESREARDKRVEQEKKEAAAVQDREAKATAVAQAKLWSELDSADLKTLVQRLRSAGFPPDVIRSIVSAEINRQFAAKMRALMASRDDLPYWKAQGYGMINSKLMEQRNQLFRERTRMLRDVLGDDLLATGTEERSAALKIQFGNLSKAKIDLVHRINDDYSEMSSDVRSAARGMILQEDRDKLALLEREKQADLASVLTPQELEDYEMRTSSITGRLRSALTLMDASEEEFRALYSVEKAFEKQLYPAPGGFSFSPDTIQQRRDAEQAMNAQITQVLGDARAAEFFRDSSGEFQQLARTATAQNLPMDAAVKAYDLRAAAAAQSVQIVDDRSLSVDQKRTALKALADTTKAQLIATLGQDAGTNYTNSAGWLQAIERGSAVTLSPNGMSTRSISQPQRRE